MQTEILFGQKRKIKPQIRKLKNAITKIICEFAVNIFICLKKDGLM